MNSTVPNPSPARASNNTPLTIDDIADQRAYARERDTFRAHVMELKARRRVHLGPVISMVFECRDTIRFQIQEMARVEKILTDEAIQTELDIYNPLIPPVGELRASLFIECTTPEQMREWFPKLVGIERRLELRIGGDPAGGTDAVVVRSVPEAAHAEHLTRDDITSAVHYLEFHVGAEHADALAAGPVALAVTHPAYREEIELAPSTREALAADVRGQEQPRTVSVHPRTVGPPEKL